jgi:hypothetical protein
MGTKDVTSKRVGKIASKVLRNPLSGSAAKSTAGSALVQRPDRKKGR